MYVCRLFYPARDDVSGVPVRGRPDGRAMDVPKEERERGDVMYNASFCKCVSGLVLELG